MLHNPLGLRLGHPLHLAKFPQKKFQNVPWCHGSALKVIWVARHGELLALENRQYRTGVGIQWGNVEVIEPAARVREKSIYCHGSFSS